MLKTWQLNLADELIFFIKKGIISHFHPGDTIKYEKKNKQGKITQTEIFIADGVNFFDGKVCCGTKKKLFKFCRRTNKVVFQLQEKDS